MRKEFILLLLLSLSIHKSYGQTDPQTPEGEIIFDKGIDKFKAGDYKGAVYDFTRVIEIEPKSVTSYFNRGSAKSKLKDYRGAVLDHNKAIELQPDNVYAHYERGLVKTALKDYRAALQDFDTVIELQQDLTGPYNKVDAYLTRGIIKIYSDDLDGACMDWSKAGELGGTKAYDYIQKYCK